MVNIQPYSERAIRLLYDHLVAKQRNGVDFEYEVRFDGEPIFPRSRNLEEFYAYVPAVNEYTRSVEVLVYLGASKRYTKYVFTIEGHQLQHDDIEQRIREGIEKGLRQQQADFELQRLQKKVKDQKELIKEYRRRVEKLESSSMSGLDSLVGMLKDSGLIEKLIVGKGGGLAGTETDANPLNGNMLNVLNELQRELGDETYQRLLGVSLLLAHHPQLIPEVETFINQSTKK